MHRIGFAALATLAGIAACTAPAPVTAPPTSPATTVPASGAALPPTVPTSGPITSPPTTAAPAPPPVFAGQVQVLPPDVVTLMTGRSWRPGCPVGLDQLRLITASHWGFDGRVHTGRVVVHRDHADAVLGVLRTLFTAHFPIERLQLVDDFGADDAASMAANNTSAFNCRGIDGKPGVWSEHSFGWAIDINPVQNPWVRGTQVDPPAGAPYVDRSRQQPGMIHSGDAVVTAFTAAGWTWGGTFRTAQDYQHFSASGR